MNDPAAEHTKTQDEPGKRTRDEIKSSKGKSLSRYLIIALGFAISAISVYVIIKKIDINETIQQIRQVSPIAIAGMIAVYLSGFLARGLRWRIMLSDLKNVPFTSTTGGVILGYAGNNVLPARGGELVRMEYLTRKEQISRVTALSSIFTERVLDGLSLLLLLLLSIVLSDRQLFETAWITELVFMTAIVFGGAILTIVAVNLFMEQIRTWATRKWSGKKSIQMILKLMDRIHEAVKFIRLDQRTFAVITLSLAVWTIEGFVFVWGINAFGFGIDLPRAFFCLAVVNFGLLVPSSPSFIGVFQAVTIIALGLFNISQEYALSISVVVHASMIVPITLIGLGIFILNLHQGKQRC